MYLALQVFVFRWEQIHFNLDFNKIRFYLILRSVSMIEIHFSWHVDNLKLFLSQKSQFDLIEKIKNENKIALTHHFFNLQMKDLENHGYLVYHPSNNDHVTSLQSWYSLKIIIKVVQEDFSNTCKNLYWLHFPFYNNFLTIWGEEVPPRSY